jgi:CheY-specific phosphatase CheX
MKHPPEINIGPVSEWLIQAVQDVSETMFGLGVYPAEQDGGTNAAEEAVVACIGIRGECRLEVALHFPESLASHLASISLEMPAAELDEKMVDDVAGEFSNMVVGAVKSRISDLDVPCSMTVPRVVRKGANAGNAAQKVEAALAIIRGSAGPRDKASSAHSCLLFHAGASLLQADLFL